jgi:enoyl-CoA hydratase/carnithine racemase
VTNSLSFDGGVALVRLSAGKANAMSTELLDQIQRAMVELESSGARSAVITGYDRYFSAGLALPTLIDLEAEETERWLDTWFSPPARALLTETVRKLSSPRG